MKTFNILLTSGGFNDLYNEVSKANIELFTEVAKGKKVMILANAAPEGTGNFPARERVKQNFLKIGATQVDITEIADSNIHTLMEYDVIYGIGGDPYYLIELVNTTNFKDVFIKFLNRGLYIGESAGSMILCDDLEWAYVVKKGTKPKYDITLETYKGLGITEYRIFPHWNKVSDIVKEKVTNYEKDNSTTITKLNDGDIIEVFYKQH